MQINLLKIAFTFMTSFIIILGGLVNTVEKYLPLYIAQVFRYGKHAYQGKETFIKLFEVPKRWFRHFYVFAALYTSFATVMIFRLYFLKGTQSYWLLYLLDLLASSERKASVSSLSAFMALVLLCVQAWHRLYETWFVSVFSDARMNISHYLIGYIHYFGAVAAVLAESPGFIYVNEVVPTVSMTDISFLHFLGCTLFLWACYQQYRSGVILANLRKDNKGQVVSLKHSVPYGHWFELVSSPHLFMEVLMYMSLTCILWGNTTWLMVFMWVLANQIESALLTHWWYQSTFKNYPPLRKAILPYIL